MNVDCLAVQMRQWSVWLPLPDGTDYIAFHGTDQNALCEVVRILSKTTVKGINQIRVTLGDAVNVAT